MSVHDSNDQLDDSQQRSEERGSLVRITINNKSYDVHRGRETVAMLKQIAGISPADELDEVEEGQLIPLPDDGAVTIKGGEVFVSNLKVGHSS